MSSNLLKTKLGGSDMKMFISSLMLIASVFLYFSNPVAAEDKKKDEGQTFDAYVAATQSSMPGASTPVECVIKSYTTEQQKKDYYALLKSQGQMALFNAVKNNNLGFCRIGPSLGQQLMIVGKVALPDGSTRINAVFMSVRGTFETRAASKAEEFPFALVEMIMKPNGQGDGMIAPAVGITINEQGAIDLENIGAYPGKLMELHEKK
jgi:hypothetical protein